MYTRTMLGLDDAQKIAHAIMGHVAKRNDPPVSIAIVDARGDLLLFIKMDGSSWNSGRMAPMKAYSAAKMRLDTSAIRQRMASIGVELLDWGDPDLTTLTGGVCIRDESGTVIGGVGVSGYPGPPDDEEAARAGVAALA